MGYLNPLIATTIWGTGLAGCFALIVVDRDYTAFLTDEPAMLALIVGLWLAITGAAYLRFREIVRK